MEFLVFSDVHYYTNPSKSRLLSNGTYSWLNKQIEITNDICTYAEQHNIKLIIHNGDLFEEKNRINVELYNRIWEFYRQLSKRFDIIFNMGNHDLYSLKDSSLKPFSDIVRLIEEPSSLIIEDYLLHFIPFGQVQSNLPLPKSSCKRNLLFLHEEIAGLKFGSTDHSSSSPINYSLLKEWDWVFNGHIHKPQNFANVINIGSPMIQDWGETGESKRFIHFNNSKINSIDIDCPKFITLHSLSEIETINDTDYFRIIISPEEADHVIFRLYNVFPSIIKSRKRSQRLKESSSSMEEDIGEYINLKAPETLDKKRLLEIGLSFLK